MENKTNELALHGDWRSFSQSEQPCGAFSLGKRADDQGSLFSTETDPWHEYERRKRELPAELTPAEYMERIKEICRALNL